MRRHLVATVSIVCFVGLLAACGGKAGPGGVVGTWEMDKDQTKAEAEKQAKAAGQDAKLALRMIEAGNVEFTIESGGTWRGTMSGGPEPSKADGTWTLGAGKLTLKVAHENGKEVPDEDPVTGTVEGDRIRLDMGGNILVLRRK